MLSQGRGALANHLKKLSASFLTLHPPLPLQQFHDRPLCSLVQQDGAVGAMLLIKSVKVLMQMFSLGLLGHILLLWTCGFH